MILEEKTYEKFGYYPSDFKPKSRKKILVACDKCGKIKETQKRHYRPLCISCAHKGKYHTEEAKRKMSEATKGMHHSRETKQKISESHKGISLSKEIREKISKAKKGKHLSEETKKKLSKANKGKRLSKEHKKKLSKARQHRYFPSHHTKPELIFEAICKKHNLPFKYTGDGSFWIHNVNPDFVEVNGKKIAVEIFGDYWHSPLLNRGLKENRTLSYRKRILKKYGWKLIVFWETDLKRKDPESFILLQLKRN